jgi:hypothetical protein
MIEKEKKREKTRVGIPNAALKCSAQKSLKSGEKSLNRESENIDAGDARLVGADEWPLGFVHDVVFH